jgi:excisionase family DNA binding protein
VSASTRLLRVEDAAKILGVGRSKAYELVAARLIPVVTMGRSVRVPETALMEWIDEHTEEVVEA